MRILVADGSDRLPGALELQNDIGAEVRFDPAVHLADLNYICVDISAVILASRHPTAATEGYVRSTSSVEFQGNSLAVALTREFDQRWTALTTRTLNEQFREALPGMIRASSVDAVARELHLPRPLVDFYRHPKPITVLIIGRPGAGKTAVAKKIIQQARAIGLAHHACHLDDLRFIGQIFAAEKRPDPRFQKLDEGGFFIHDRSLYRDALEDLASQASRASSESDLVILEFARSSYQEALQILGGRGVEADLVIYLDVSLQTALERNRIRARRTEGDNHFVSEKEMKLTYATDDINDLIRSHSTKTTIIRNEVLDESHGQESADKIIQLLKAML